MSQTIEQQIQTLANDSGLSFSDVKNFANMIASGISKDKAAVAYCDNEEFQINFCKAYAEDVARKIASFQTIYHMSEAAKTALRNKVHFELTGYAS